VAALAPGRFGARALRLRKQWRDYSRSGAPA
jgi:hypothetical protein